MIKKMILLALSLVALVAFAAPVSASAAGTLTHNGNPVPAGEHVTLHAAGWVGFFVHGVGSYECATHSEIELESGNPSTGTATYEITPSDCYGAGAYTGCELSEFFTNAPWNVVAGSNKLVIEGAEEEITLLVGFHSPCPMGEAEINFPSITATPTSSTELHTLMVSGTGTYLGGAMIATAYGSLTVEETGYDIE
jgi:hypothetical protein